ncbi:nucleotidyltransferase family protein [Aurantivibrio infirmus]
MNQDWRNVLISPTASIHEAIEIIDKEALRLALVVDSECRLLGTITDGDVRRALIRRKQLSAPVREIMNTEPKTADIDTPRDDLLKILEKDDLLSIPLIQEQKVVGLETLQHLLKKPKYENPIFLMAGGFGRRLRPLTDHCPKPLLKVGDKPILETILESFVSSGFSRFYISTHFMSEKIRQYFRDGSNWGVTIEYVHEKEPLGTGGALGLLPSDLPDYPIIVMNGDVLTKIDFEKLLNYHNEFSAVATMCVREFEHQVPYGVIQADGHKVVRMEEKPSQKYFINAGIYVLSREVIESVEKNQKIDMPTLLEKHIDENKTVAMFPLHEYWLDIGRLNDFERAQADFVQRFKNV